MPTHSSTSDMSSQERAHVRGTLRGARVVLGVSLGNKEFSLAFFSSAQKWLATHDIKNLLILLFDVCEAVNFEVFKMLTPSGARERATRRAVEVQRGIERRLSPIGYPVTVRLESELWREDELEIGATYERLRAAYAEDQAFHADVLSQLNINIGTRFNEVPESLRGDLMHRAADYILRELAVFVALYAHNIVDAEVYPGPQLFVQSNLWEGKYPFIANLRASYGGTFVNISGLVPEANPPRR